MKPVFLSSLSCRLSPAASPLSSARLAVLLLVAASFTLIAPASAQQFKVTATGKITSVSDGGGVYNSSVVVGTPYTFSFLFNYSALDAYPTDPTRGIYALSGTGLGSTAAFGDYSFTPTTGTIGQVAVDRNNQDRLDLEGFYETATSSGTSQPAYFVGLTVIEPFNQFLTSDALPPVSAYAAANLSASVYGFSVQTLLSGSSGNSIISAPSPP